MSADYNTRISHSFRLPSGVAEALESIALQRGLSKTEVVSEAIELMSRQHTEALIAEGFAEMASEDTVDAELAVRSALEVSDEW